MFQPYAPYKNDINAVQNGGTVVRMFGEDIKLPSSSLGQKPTMVDEVVWKKKMIQAIQDNIKARNSYLLKR